MRFLSIILLMIAFESQSQSYTVIHIIGKIYDTQSGSYLAKGSKVSESANLKFETGGARAAVLGASRGRFVIQENSSSTSQSDAIYALSSVISPVRGRLSTRAGAINNALDFQKHFNESPVALVGDQYSVKVSSESYPITDQQFFFAQYQLGEENINKKLGGANGKLQIDINDFFSVDGKAIDPSKVSNVKLHYYDAGAGTSTFITDMNLSYISDEELESLTQQFPDDNTALLEVINAMYGKCSEAQLNEALGGL